MTIKMNKQQPKDLSGTGIEKMMLKFNEVNSDEQMLTKEPQWGIARVKRTYREITNIRAHLKYQGKNNQPGPGVNQRKEPTKTPT